MCLYVMMKNIVFHVLKTESQKPNFGLGSVLHTHSVLVHPVVFLIFVFKYLWEIKPALENCLYVNHIIINDRMEKY